MEWLQAKIIMVVGTHTDEFTNPVEKKKNVMSSESEMK